MIDKVEWWLNTYIFKKLGFILARKSTLDNDSKVIYYMVATTALQEGRQIGIIEVLRFAKATCSEAKFKEFSDEFGFEELDKKYPVNPLIEVPHGQATPERIHI